jgi:thymidylate synthase ThyX
MVEVILAGQTIDTEFLRLLRQGELPPDIEPSPETISAAYARISRFPESVTELRAQARRDVPAARKSNRTIVFRMSHHSVAEHVQLNFDILNTSRLAIEALEEARLCSYTEKSQRYITLRGDYVRPVELKGDDLDLFERITAEQVALYLKAFPILHELQKGKHPDMLGNKTDQETVEGWAKEDARYALNLATEGQLGFSANARNLEYIVRKLRHHPLAEVRDLSRQLFDRGCEVVPSLIILSDPVKFKEQFGKDISDGFMRDGRNKLEQLASSALDGPVDTINERMLELLQPVCYGRLEGDTKLVGYTPDADTRIVAALIHSSARPLIPYGECFAMAEGMKAEGRREFVKQALADLTAFDAVFREFEYARFLFEVNVSSTEFAQWKRHRMATITKQPYDPSLGYTYPDSVVEAGLKQDYNDLYDKTSEAFRKISASNPFAAEYVLANGHRRRMLADVSVRELYHIARLRMDEHAQWDIRRTAGEMVKLAERVAPATVLLACGKDEFASLREKVYGSSCEDK